MFFKNITVFKLNQEIDCQTLQQQLSDFAFAPCKSFDASSTGWIHPFCTEHSDLSYRVNNFHLLCLKTEDKILPAQVINEHTAQKIADIERLQNTTIGKHEKASIKEEVAQNLLTKAFSKSRLTFGYFDIANQYLVIDSTSDKVIDEMIALLRKALGSLKIEPVFEDISGILTTWFRDNATPDDMVLEDKCKLTSDQGNGVANISCQGDIMLSENIVAFIEAGGTIAELAISWRDQLSFTLTDRFQCKSIKFLEGITSLNNALSQQDDVIKAEADFLLMAETFSELLDSLMTACQPTEADSNCLQSLAY